MILEENLRRQIKAGNPLKPWLILGPFYEDVSARVEGLTSFEEPGGTNGHVLLDELIAEARSIMLSAPHESDEIKYRSQRSRWSLVRSPEPFLTWGTHFLSNHAGVAFVSTIVTPQQLGVHTLRLHTHIALSAVVAINGKIVFETGMRSAIHLEGFDDSEFHFDADLKAGDNIVTMGLFRMGRAARLGFRLDIANTDVTARIPLDETHGVLRAARVQVEATLSGIRLERDVFYPEHSIALHLQTAPKSETPLTVRLLSAQHETLRQVVPTSAGAITLCRGDAIADGAYQIVCEWTDQHGKPLTATAYTIFKTTPTPPMIGYDRLNERKHIALQHYAARPDARPLWQQIARYALGQFDEIDENAIRATCDFIAARNDCADFVMQGILRLLYWEHQTPHLSSQIRALMKETVLGFKYWVDEPGNTVMWMDSENHRFLFHVAEWLAGQLYPLDEFSNSRQRGLYHAAKGRMYAMEWMRERGHFGFDEWHSNTYYPLSISPLLNVYDFALYEDHKLRLLAGALLDYMFFNLAADSFRGVFGTTHGRSYTNDLKHPNYENVSSTNWVMFGQGALRNGSGGMCPVSIATSTYRLPKIIADIADDNTSVVESKIRQGIASKGAEEYFANSDRFADFCVYRTPDYMLSGLQDHRKGEYEPAAHPAQVTLGNQAIIFWSCPYTTSEGSGVRPDYWSGNKVSPRVIQYRNVMSLTWRLNADTWMTHCFFEQVRFDKVRFGGNWVFACVDRGYVGIYSQNGMRVADSGQYAVRELICEARENTWLVECGRKADWGSFDVFVRALGSAKLETRDGVIEYASPSVGRFVTGWDVTPTINDKPIQLHGNPLVDSAWAHSDFGSGALTIRYGDQIHEIYFNQ